MRAGNIFVAVFTSRFLRVGSLRNGWANLICWNVQHPGQLTAGRLETGSGLSWCSVSYYLRKNIFHCYCWWFRNPAHQLRLVVYPIIYKVLYIPGGCLGFLPSTAMLVYQKRYPVTTKERFFITIGEKSLQFLRAISTRQMLTSMDCFLGLYGFTRQQQERPKKFVDGGFLPKYLGVLFFLASGARWCVNSFSSGPGWPRPGLGTSSLHPSEVAYQLCVQETHHVSGIERRGCMFWTWIHYICWVIPLPSNSHHQDDTTCVPSFATITRKGAIQIMWMKSYLVSYCWWNPTTWDV